MTQLPERRRFESWSVESWRDWYTFSHAVRTLSHRYIEDRSYPFRIRLRASASSRSSRTMLLAKACQSPVFCSNAIVCAAS